MTEGLHATSASFDARAATYAGSDWHRLHAERLVDLVGLTPGQRVLDAGAGTGFATIAIARQVGPSGQVVGVDVSEGMLARARTTLAAAGLANVELVQDDATDLRQFPAHAFDAVICSAALLYMPVDRALREWHRLLRPNGLVGVSTMRAGSPPAGELFRTCAATFGVHLQDPSHELGSEERCRAALESAGFSDVSVTPGQVTLSAADLMLAWDANHRSARHAAVRELSRTDQDALRASYEEAVRRARLEDEASFARAEVLYAFGRR